jgi:pimeloyl-ACP methyl ester carboxylesterase
MAIRNVFRVSIQSFCVNIPEEWVTDTVRSNGIDLQYYRTGDGPPLVMAHAFCANGRCWIPLAEDLTDDYDVITYDARGHGRSDAPETGYGIENRIADLVGVVNELDLTDPILLGHSMGAATVAWTAAEYPDLPRALILEDPIGLYGTPDMGPDERAQAVRENLRDRANRSVEEEIAANYDDFNPDWARRFAVASAECSLNIAEIGREGYPSLLDDVFVEITCPTLVLKADADTDQRVKDLQVADKLENSRLIHVPDAGHYVFCNEYDAAYAELRAFLQRV